MTEDAQKTLAFQSFCRLWKPPSSLDRLDYLYGELFTQNIEVEKKFTSSTFEDILSGITFSNEEILEFDVDDAYDEFFEATAVFDKSFHDHSCTSVWPICRTTRRPVLLDCDKINNLYLSAIKTPGYGRKFGFTEEKEDKTFYNNCFDPRLQFKGLLDEKLLFWEHKKNDKKVDQNLFLALENISDILYDHISKYRLFLSVLTQPYDTLITDPGEKIHTPDSDGDIHTPSDAILDTPKFPVIINTEDKEEMELIERVLADKIQSIWTGNCNVPRTGKLEPISCPVSTKWSKRLDPLDQLDLTPVTRPKVETTDAVAPASARGGSGRTTTTDSEDIDQYLKEIWSEIHEKDLFEDITDMSVSSFEMESQDSQESIEVDNPSVPSNTEEDINSTDDGHQEEAASVSQKKCTSQPELSHLAESVPDSKREEQQQHEEFQMDTDVKRRLPIKPCPSDSALYTSPSRLITTKGIKDATELVGQPIPVQTTNRQEVPRKHIAQVQRSGDYPPSGWHTQCHQTWTYINATGRPQSSYPNRLSPGFSTTSQVPGAHWTQGVQDSSKQWLQQQNQVATVPHNSGHHHPHQHHHQTASVQFCQPKYSVAQDPTPQVQTWQQNQLAPPVAHLGLAGGQVWQQWQKQYHVPGAGGGQASSQQQIQGQIFQHPVSKLPPGGLPQTYSLQQVRQGQMGEPTPYQQPVPSQSWQTRDRIQQKKSYPVPTRTIHPVYLQNQKLATYASMKDTGDRHLLAVRPQGINPNNLVQIKVEDLFQSAVAHQGQNNPLQKPVSLNQVSNTLRSPGSRTKTTKPLDSGSTSGSPVIRMDHSCGGVELASERATPSLHATPSVVDSKTQEAIEKLENTASMLTPNNHPAETGRNHLQLLNVNSEVFVPGKSSLLQRIRAAQSKSKAHFSNQTAVAAARKAGSGHLATGNAILWTSNAIHSHKVMSAWKNISQGK
ncbi:uncharacterized protein LOC106163884 [Lingula anatina]|uniref:Uncharacterized protein LOC106163884 n=1 Tax=Lingula anatina TaxID=7574 RepID=A0A1S3IHT6_LINAN|nr:uncharacterized protein LOC106163884 [Lingula anatina]|eukprot:XP_013397054.1 uncharacterized protein LOC106163884 [Lingula anatina]